MTSTEELERLLAEATKHFKLPFVADLATMKIFDAEYRMVADIRGWGYLTGKGDGALGLSEDEGIAAQRELITGIVAAVNALPELVALRKEVGRLRAELEAARVLAWLNDERKEKAPSDERN